MNTASLLCAIWFANHTHISAQLSGSIVVSCSITEGGDSKGNDVTNVLEVSCGDTACATLKGNASAVAWGNIDQGGDKQNKDVTGVTQITFGGYA